MIWKSGVVVTRKGDNLLLTFNAKEQKVKNKDIYLVEAVENGISNDEDLKRIIAVHEKSNEVMASLSLANFILCYQNFIDEDKEHYKITY